MTAVHISPQQILNDMKKAGYHPTVETFNMALMGLDSTVRSKKTSENVEYGLKLIADMKNLGIGKCTSVLSC